MSSKYLDVASRDVVLPEWVSSLEEVCSEHLTKAWDRDRAADLWIEHGADLILKVRQLKALLAASVVDVRDRIQRDSIWYTEASRLAGAGKQCEQKQY